MWSLHDSFIHEAFQGSQQQHVYECMKAMQSLSWALNFKICLLIPFKLLACNNHIRSEQKAPSKVKVNFGALRFFSCLKPTAGPKATACLIEIKTKFIFRCLIDRIKATRKICTRKKAKEVNERDIKKVNFHFLLPHNFIFRKRKKEKTVEQRLIKLWRNSMRNYSKESRLRNLQLSIFKGEKKKIKVLWNFSPKKASTRGKNLLWELCNRNYVFSVGFNISLNR